MSAIGPSLLSLRCTTSTRGCGILLFIYSFDMIVFVLMFALIKQIFTHKSTQQFA